MEPTLLELRWSIVEAVELLGQADVPLDTRADRARALLLAALCRFHHTTEYIPHAPSIEPNPPTTNTIPNDLDLDDSIWPQPRRLSDYRQERGMRIPEFTAFLGILHHEYAAVVHRHPVDRRLRDQIAFKLGVHWSAIAEFLPAHRQPIKPPPPPVPIPNPSGEVPSQPWYLVDAYTGQIVSGPHHEPVPLNGYYMVEPLSRMCTNLIVLDDYSGTEEDQLPPEGYSDKELRSIYGDGAWDDD
jgi:hypothetical protein